MMMASYCQLYPVKRNQHIPLFKTTARKRWPRKFSIQGLSKTHDVLKAMNAVNGSAVNESQSDKSWRKAVLGPANTNENL
jgi:hypothetical protein